MSLDMFAYASKKTLDEVRDYQTRMNADETWSESLYQEFRREVKEFRHWKDHHSLDSVISALYDGDEEFNCVYMQLTKDDLDNIVAAIDNKLVLYEDNEEDLEEYDNTFLSNSYDLLKKGYNIYYSCWY